MLRVLLSILLSLVIASSVQAALPSNKPLPPDQAFVFSAQTDQNHNLVLNWQLAPGYYLYRDRFHFTPTPTSAVKVGRVIMPAGQFRDDSIHGHYQIYTDSLSIPVPSKGTGQLELMVNYQGCANSGFCYAPFKKIVSLDLADKTAQPVIIDGVTKKVTLMSQSYADKLFDGHHLFLVIFGFLGLGILLAFTPCVLPMVPILSGIIVGHGRQISTAHAFFLSLAYVSGMALTYAVAGVLVALIGGSIQVAFQKPWVIALFSGFFVLLALSLFGVYELALPSSWQQRLTALSNKQKGGTYLGVFAMGVLSALIVSPCVSAPLVGVLAYIAKTGDMVLGGTALLALGYGMGLPLLLLGTSAGKLLPKAGAWMEDIKKFFGILMLGIAIWMLARVIPGSIALFLWAVLLIFTAVFIGVFAEALTHWAKLRKTFGVVMLIYGAILMVGSVLGNSDPLHPWDGLRNSANRIARANQLPFIDLKNMEQVDQQLALAKANKKPVMIDFYADWCTSCILLEKRVFSRTDVRNALTHFVLLRANVTDNNVFDQALLKRFNVIAPPTMVFFGSEGNTIQPLVGEVSKKEFLAYLQQVA